MKTNLHAVIMAGGAGTRFWPASRMHRPKQLLDLTGSGETMIAATASRLAPLIAPERIWVVTGAAIAAATAEALPDVPTSQILAEPVGRNTAPCIGWAALHVRRRDPDAVLAVMPSDHLVADVPAFQRSVEIAAAAARQGAIVTFGVVPDRPETGFGYLEVGEEVAPGVRATRRFVEKPDRETAARWLAAGNYLWNSGMFFFCAQRILNAIATHLPDLKDGLDRIDRAIGTPREQAVVAEVFPTLPAVSIDYGVMEQAPGVQCVPVRFGWSDLGSWGAAQDRHGADDRRNAVDGDAVMVDTAGCFVRAPAQKLVALVGVSDLLVVDTGDALLVCRRDADQDVKKVVEELKRRGRTDLL